MRRALFLAPLLLLAACHSRAQTASERLRDAVVGYNDELRFSRQDLAVQRVRPELRGQFVGSHYRWGRGIEIAEVEIVNVEAAGEDLENALSFVTFRWFNQGAMIVRETLVRQEWLKEGGQYVLVAESAIDGDASLLSIPEGFRPETSGLLRSALDAGTDAAVEPDAGIEADAPTP